MGSTRCAWTGKAFLKETAMPDEAILREKAREAILSGRLPTTRPRVAQG